MDKYNDPTATAAGEFTDGDPGTVPPVPRTVLRSIWPNMIQRELLSVLDAGDVDPDPDEFDQVAQAIEQIAAAKAQAVLEDIQGELKGSSIDVELDGDFTNGSLRLVRLGPIVVGCTSGLVAHPSMSAPDSSNNIWPAGWEPWVIGQTVAFSRNDLLCMITLTPDFFGIRYSYSSTGDDADVISPPAGLIFMYATNPALVGN